MSTLFWIWFAVVVWAGYKGIKRMQKGERDPSWW